MGKRAFSGPSGKRATGLDNPSSIKMRQDSEIYRQSMIRYKPEEIAEFIAEDSPSEDQKTASKD